VEVPRFLADMARTSRKIDDFARMAGDESVTSAYSQCQYKG
jgi:hypothetical protein